MPWSTHGQHPFQEGHASALKIGSGVLAALVIAAAAYQERRVIARYATLCYFYA